MRKKISRIKRGLAVMLSVCMVFGVAPIQAGAEESGTSVSGNEMQIQQSANENETDVLQAGAEENDSEIAVQATARNAMQPYISQLLKQLTNMTLTMTARKRLFTKSAMQVSCTGLQDL